MGIRTYFTLSIIDTTEEQSETIISQFREEYNGAADAFNDEGYPEDETSWHSCNDDLREFSKKYPEHVFRLDGEGSDGNLWACYAKNGKLQEVTAEIIYPEYDESKLT